MRPSDVPQDAAASAPAIATPSPGAPPAWTLNPSLRGPFVWAAGLGAGFLFLALLFAAFVPLNGAVVASGEIVVSSQRKAVQHPEGGAVRAVHAKDGDVVEAGALLVSLDDPRLRGEQEGLLARLADLYAERRRLQTEEGIALAPDADLTALESRGVSTAGAVRDQENYRVARANNRHKEEGLLAEQRRQTEEQISGAKALVQGYKAQGLLIDDELSGIRALADKGLVPKTRVRALERSAVELSAQGKDQSARIAQYTAALAEIDVRLSKIAADFARDVAEQRQRNAADITNLLPRLAAADQVLANMTLRAPARGTVVFLRALTPGAALGPKENAVEIVPDQDELRVEAQVPPDQVVDLQDGMTAHVRLSALRRQGMPMLQGAVTKVSPDRLTDPRSGAPYFKVQVTLAGPEIAAFKSRLHPGMPVEVMVPTDARTVLDYITSPLVRRLDRAFVAP